MADIVNAILRKALLVSGCLTLGTRVLASVFDSVFTVSSHYYTSVQVRVWVEVLRFGALGEQ